MQSTALVLRRREAASKDARAGAAARAKPRMERERGFAGVVVGTRHPSRLAALAPQDEGGAWLRLSYPSAGP